jgi:hypothetical protein
MKVKYIKPEINTEVLIKEDLLQVSEETENKYLSSKKVLPDNFSIEDIL